MRLVTRGDLDGLTCAVFISSCEEIEDIQLAHPQDITEKRLFITEDDIIANLPYQAGCGKWFDHHLITESTEKPPEKFEGRYGLAPSAARMAYEYYLSGHPELQSYEVLLAETDRLDSAQLTLDDVLEPENYIQLGYTLDPRTGLGAYREYFLKMVDWVKQKPIEEIMELPEVQERVDLIKENDVRFHEILRGNSRVDGNVVLTDLRSVSPLPVGNRFIVYTVFSQVNVSVRAHWGPTRLHVACAVGHSIFNRTCRTPVGKLMAKYGGGGHRGAGTCLLPADRADELIDEIITVLKQDG